MFIYYAIYVFKFVIDKRLCFYVLNQVHPTVVLPIIQKFADTCSETLSTLKHLLQSLPIMKLSPAELKKERSMLSYWEIGLDAWLKSKPTSAFDSQVHRWIFFYNVLQLGAQLQNGIVSCKFERQSLCFSYSSMQINPINLTTVTFTQLEKDVSVIDTLDIILHEKRLPLCGLSQLSQNLLSIAGLLLLIQYNSIKSSETNQFLSSSTNATLLCKVLLSCFINWLKADSPDAVFLHKRKQKKKHLSPLLNVELLMKARSALYSVLNMVNLKQCVTVPSIYFEGIDDAVISSIF